MSKKIGEQVTIVTACRNREDNLRKVIQSWLDIYPCRIIICDWGSADPLTHERLGIRELKDAVNIIRRESDRWILSWAFNEALLRVESKYTLKLDCDHLISKDFLESNPPCFGQFSRGHWRHAEEGQQYINGAFMSCTDLLRRVGYYDERITTYGWDDSDLYSRLYDAGIGSSVFTKGSLSHLEQCETTRTKEQDVSKEAALARHLDIEKTAFLINRNRILCGMLWPWNSNMFKRREEIRARFLAPEPEEEALIEHATLKAFEFQYQWKGLLGKTGIPAGEAYAEALYSLNQNHCHSPSSLSIAKLLRRYSDAIRNNDDDERNLVRMALLANSPETRLKDRIEALNQVDQMRQDAQLNNLNSIRLARRDRRSPLILTKNQSCSSMPSMDWVIDCELLARLQQSPRQLAESWSLFGNLIIIASAGFLTFSSTMVRCLILPSLMTLLTATSTIT
jgi:Glycosyltransferases involved in cell wall biogenesis